VTDWVHFKQIRYCCPEGNSKWEGIRSQEPEARSQNGAFPFWLLASGSWLLIPSDPEFLLKDSVHVTSMMLVVAQEFFRRELAIIVLITEQAGAHGQFLMVPGYGVRLRVVHHLKFVLHIAQKDVSPG